MSEILLFFVKDLPGSVSVFIAGFIVALGIIFFSVKFFKVKGFSVNLGKNSNKEFCSMHEFFSDNHTKLWEKYDILYADLGETKEDVAEVKNDVKWLRRKHEDDSTRDMMKTILEKLDK